jgi:protein TonB
MFEDSTFESTGSIHTRSRRWMIATFGLNAVILVGLVLIPLLYPEALPRMAMAMLMEAPSTPPEQPKPVLRPEHAPAAPSEMQAGILLAPSRIPRQTYIPGKPEEPTADTVIALGGAGAGNPDNPFAGHNVRPDVRPAVHGPAPVSKGVMAGLLIYKVTPKYPQIAVAMHLGGTVVLQATISRSGTIENLRAVGGPALLQQAAIDAVQQWRYRPYLLNGEPVEVETTVNVEFTLQ